jgi:hypothetical protein
LPPELNFTPYWSQSFIDRFSKVNEIFEIIALSFTQISGMFQLELGGKGTVDLGSICVTLLDGPRVPIRNSGKGFFKPFGSKQAP